MDLERRLVEVVQANLLGKLPADGRILVRTHGAIPGDDQAVLRPMGPVAVRRIDDVGSATKDQLAGE